MQTAEAPDEDAPTGGLPGRRVDWGRAIALPLLVGALLANVRALGRWHWEQAGNLESALSVLSGATTVAFYTLVVWAYLRRGPALATMRSDPAYAAAILAAFLPFAFPLLGYRIPATPVLLTADVLMIAGVGLAVWGVRHLDRSFSVVPQARAVVTTGPYRFVRHPLYAGELLAAVGLVLLVGSLAGVVMWVVLALLQLFRARQEEAVLAAHLAGYPAYANRTGQFFPRLRAGG